MDACCDKMADLVMRQQTARIGVCAILPSQALPEADAHHTVETAPCLVFRSVSRDRLDVLREAAVAGKTRVLGEMRTYINFCPFCGRDWRVPSVAAALSHLTRAEAVDDLRYRIGISNEAEDAAS